MTDNHVYGTWRIARPAGIDLRLHWSFSLLLVWVGWRGIADYPHWHRAGLIAGLLLILFGAVLLHELGHALTARWLSVGVKNIIILPVGGVTQIEFLPNRPGYEVLIAAAGPLVNLGLALCAAGMLWAGGQLPRLQWLFAAPEAVTEDILQAILPQEIGAGVLLFGVMINSLLFAFNLIPAFPLDGGRIVRAGLVMVLPYRLANRISLFLGLTIAGVMLLLAYPLKSIGLLFAAGLILLTSRLLKNSEPEPK